MTESFGTKRQEDRIEDEKKKKKKMRIETHECAQLRKFKYGTRLRKWNLRQWNRNWLSKIQNRKNPKRTGKTHKCTHTHAMERMCKGLTEK